MSIEKINPNTKQKLKVVGISTLVGANLAIFSNLANNVKVKDVFQYKNLAPAQKKIAKWNLLGGLAVAGLLMLVGMRGSDKKS